MNIEEELIPLGWAKLFGTLLESEVINNENHSLRTFLVDEQWVHSLIQKISGGKMNKMNLEDAENEKMNVLNPEIASKNENDLLLFDNEPIKPNYPKGILEIKERTGANFLKSVYIFKKMSLKEAADRYGGKSAAANLSNFFAKPDGEIRLMRKSTLEKICLALDIPYSWVREFYQLMG